MQRYFTLCNLITVLHVKSFRTVVFQKPMDQIICSLDNDKKLIPMSYLDSLGEMLIRADDLAWKVYHIFWPKLDHCAVCRYVWFDMRAIHWNLLEQIRMKVSRKKSWLQLLQWNQQKLFGLFNWNQFDKYFMIEAGLFLHFDKNSSLSTLVFFPVCKKY